MLDNKFSGRPVPPRILVENWHSSGRISIAGSGLGTKVKPTSKHWHPGAYGGPVEEILALAGNGERLIPLTQEMPLAQAACCSEEARQRIHSVKIEDLFPSSRAPRGALTGLFVYFSCWNDAHETAQDDSSTEGSFWHAIIHRQEPDSGNSSYWFHRVGAHSVFPELLDAARDIAAAHPDAHLKLSNAWDPFAFIELCERARAHPGSELERAALEIQRAEWQLLFDYCARRSSD